MSEGLTPRDDFADDSEFDHVEEWAVPSARIPFHHNGAELTLTPANAAVRLLSEDGRDDYSRVIVYPGDGSTASFKPEQDFLRMMVQCGFPIEAPTHPDESDKAFIEEYMRIWTEDVNDELDRLQ